MFNPYAQSGWANTGNPNASSSRGTFPQPSIFGALPYPNTIPASGSPTFMSFRFTSFSPTILNSAVVGPKSRTYFRVTTDVPTVGYTVVHNLVEEPIVIIEWAPQPIIEIRDIVSKRPVSDWLTLSADTTYRTMTANGKPFFWVSDSTYNCVYSSGLGAPQLHARVSRQENEVVLQITAEAIQIGLLEICIAATLLLRSDRNID
ncbi:hypothetical protein FB451DRAFT_1409887 [Mycena latifolia]|nr:hypothetical protein FB451DRAFT_1409887 [Mycena latifolia]